MTEIAKTIPPRALETLGHMQPSEGTIQPDCWLLSDQASRVGWLFPSHVRPLEKAAALRLIANHPDLWSLQKTVVYLKLSRAEIRKHPQGRSFSHLHARNQRGQIASLIRASGGALDNTEYMAYRRLQGGGEQ